MQKVAVVTGANRGIGKAIAAQLVDDGFRVLALGRNLDALREASRETGAEPLACDLASQADVRRACADVVARAERLDLLVHNAAIARAERHLTREGVEESLAVNHLAPYVMTTLLLPWMRQTPGARIVQETTGAFPPSVDFDDLAMERGYDAWSAYQRSKLVNLAWALDLGRRLRGSGITLNAVLPGAFVRTDATREFPTGFRLVLAAMRPFMMSAKAAAREVVHVATAPELEGVSGELFVKRKDGSEPKLARDPDFVRRALEASDRLTGQRA